MSTEQDRTRLRHMLDAANKIIDFTQGLSADSFQADERLQLAVVRLLEVTGEAANGISDEFKEQHPEISWVRITATRNRLIHGYFDIDLGIVWKIVTENIPPLREQLRTIM